MYYVWDLRLSSKEHSDNSFYFVELLEQFIKGSPSENHNSILYSNPKNI